MKVAPRNRAKSGCNRHGFDRQLKQSQAATDADLPWVAHIVCDIVNGAHCWLATNPDLPGCAGQGATEAEALAELWFARRDYLLSLYEAGLPCPPRRTIDDFARPLVAAPVPGCG